MSRPLRAATLVAEALRRRSDVVRLFEALAADEPTRRPPDARALQPVDELLARVGNPTGGTVRVTVR